MLNLAREFHLQEGLNTRSFVLTGLARLAAPCDTLDESVRDRLRNIAACRIEGKNSLLSAFHEYVKRPAESDVALVEVARQFRLTPIEILAVRLAVAAEQDLLVGHVLSQLQQPLAQSRPTIGLIAQAYAPDEGPGAVHVLGQGNAVRCGLLQLCGEDTRPRAAGTHPFAHRARLAKHGQLLAWNFPDRIRSVPNPLGQRRQFSRCFTGQTNV